MSKNADKGTSLLGWLMVIPMLVLACVATAAYGACLLTAWCIKTAIVMAKGEKHV